MRVEDYLTIYENLEEITKNSEKSEESDIEEINNEIKETKCNKIFAIFIYQIGKYLNSNCFKEICIFICFFRKVLNLEGWKLKNEKSSEEFCEKNNGEYIPYACNKYISEYLQIFCEEEYKNEIQNLKIIGFSDNQKLNVVYLIQHFTNWLYSNMYTSFKIFLILDNSDDEDS